MGRNLSKQPFLSGSGKFDTEKLPKCPFSCLKTQKFHSVGS